MGCAGILHESESDNLKHRTTCPVPFSEHDRDSQRHMHKKGGLSYKHSMPKKA